MKTILVPISNSFFIRNFMRTSALNTILENQEVRLLLLAPLEKITYYRNEFLHPRILFDELPAFQNFWQEKLFKILEYASIHTRTVTMLHWWDLTRPGSKMAVFKRLILFAIRRTAWQLGQFSWWRFFIRKCYYALPSSMAQSLLDKYRPDLVYCPALLNGESILLKEAKKRGIPTIGMVLSWDNFYSKLLMRVHPDHLMVGTKSIHDQAIRYGDYKAQNITIVGIAQFDRNFNRTGVKSREEFIRELGGDPSKKIILYAFSGKAGLMVDFDILDMVHESVKNGAIKYPVNVLARSYPRYDFTYEKLQKFRHDYGFMAEPAMAHVGGGNDNWEFDERSLVLLVNSLAHADIVITMYSTFFIEAAIFNKPLIAVTFDGNKRFNYYNSARRFFDWDHLAEIKSLQGITFVKSKQELIFAINESLIHLEERLDGRKAIVRQQCGFMDGKSGNRVAKVLLQQLNLSVSVENRLV